MGFAVSSSSESKWGTFCDPFFLLGPRVAPVPAAPAPLARLAGALGVAPAFGARWPFVFVLVVTAGGIAGVATALVICGAVIPVT